MPTSLALLTDINISVAFEQDLQTNLAGRAVPVRTWDWGRPQFQALWPAREAEQDVACQTIGYFSHMLRVLGREQFAFVGQNVESLWLVLVTNHARDFAGEPFRWVAVPHSRDPRT